MTNEHAERWARLRQLQAIEQQLATVRPQVEQDLRDVIDDLQRLGISQARIADRIGKSKTVVYHIAAGDRGNVQSLSEWMATLLTFLETSPRKPKGKPRGRSARVLQQASKMRGATTTIVFSVCDCISIISVLGIESLHL